MNKKKTAIASAVVMGVAVAAATALTFFVNRDFKKALDDIDWEEPFQ